MSIKNKLLGIALTGVAFANTTQTIVGNDGKKQEVTMQVNVTGDNNGQIQEQVVIEMPTTMAVVVDKDGNITGSDLKINNMSKTGNVKVSLEKDKTTLNKGEVNIHKDKDIAKLGKRNDLYLELEGEIGESVNLGEVLSNPDSQAEEKKEMLTVKAGEEKVIKIDGVAGTKEIGKKSGLKEDFKITFRLQKN